MTTLLEKIVALSTEDLIKLTEELRQTIVPENALLRQVIKDTEHDTTVPMLAFVAVQGLLSFVLADRLNAAKSDLALYEKHGYNVRELREFDEMQG